jgi:hypothetical protein
MSEQPGYEVTICEAAPTQADPPDLTAPLDPGAGLEAQSLTSGAFAQELIHRQIRRLGKLQGQVLADRDPEPLHQMRVSLRRLRTGISVRRACALLSVARFTVGHVPTQPAKDGPVIERMRHYAAMYPRLGYRRIHVYLEREGFRLGWDRMLRLWQLAKLQVPKKRQRKRVAASRPRPFPTTGPNQVMAYDLVFDARRWAAIAVPRHHRRVGA